MALTGLKTATLLAGLAGALVAPGVAQAQFYFDTWGGRFDTPLANDYGRGYDRSYRDDDRDYREAGPMSRREVASILSRRGYRVSPSMARSNDVYMVEAVDPSGRRLRLVVDAYDATILRRVDAAAPRGVARRDDDMDRWRDDDEDFGPPRASPPRVIPGVGPAQRKPAPKKPTTARVEPRAPAPKATTTEPAPVPATPPATAPAPTPPGPAASQQSKPDARAQAEPSPRVIPLYNKPPESAAEKPPEGPP
jgi:hypothetical protein